LVSNVVVSPLDYYKFVSDHHSLSKKCPRSSSVNKHCHRPYNPLSTSSENNNWDNNSDGDDDSHDGDGDNDSDNGDGDDDSDDEMQDDSDSL